MISRQVGDYEWYQANQWEGLPATCVVKVTDAGHRFYLTRVVEWRPSNIWKTEVVTKVSEVPDNVLFQPKSRVFCQDEGWEEELERKDG